MAKSSASQPAAPGGIAEPAAIPPPLDKRPRWAKYLHYRRKRSALTQGVFAQRVGASQSAVTDWERGKSRPRPNAWNRIAEVLGRPFEEVSFELGEGYLNADPFKDLDEPRPTRQLFASVYKTLVEGIEAHGWTIDAEELAYAAYHVVVQFQFSSMIGDDSVLVRDLVWDQIRVWYEARNPGHTIAREKDLLLLDRDDPETDKLYLPEWDR